MMLPAASCSMDALLRIWRIRSGREYWFQDTVTIFHTSPAGTSATSAGGGIEAENTARRSVAKNSIESARTP